MRLESFKQSFTLLNQKLTFKDDEFYGRRRAKVLEALRNTLASIEQIPSQRHKELRSLTEQHAELSGKFADAEVKSKTNPKEAYDDLELVKEQARKIETHAKSIADNVMLLNNDDGSTFEVGGKAIAFDKRMLKGIDKMPPEKQKEYQNKVMEKIAEGEALVKRIANGDVPEEKPTEKEIASVLWYVRTLADQKAGEPWERGAITIPDRDNKLRKWLDSCDNFYYRDSTHIQAKQERGARDHRPRGVDFYEGDPESNDFDMDRVLPWGMRTFLYNQYEDQAGKGQLYIKTETESARLTVGDFAKSFPKWVTTSADKFTRNEYDAWYSEEQEKGNRPRDVTSEDYWRSIKHGMNIVKGWVGMHKGTKGVGQYREQVPEEVKAAWSEVIKATRGNPKMLGILRRGDKPAGIVFEMAQNITALMQTEDIFDGLEEDHVNDFNRNVENLFFTIQRTFPDDNIESFESKSLKSKLGGEVELDLYELGVLHEDEFEGPKIGDILDNGEDEEFDFGHLADL